MLAEIATGKVGGAEVCFLIALIVGGLAAVLYVMAKNVAGALVSAAVALIAFGFVLL